MASIYVRVSAGDIRRAVKEKVTDPIVALSKNPDLMRAIAENGLEIVTPYVPMKSMALRLSGRVVRHNGATLLAWGDSTTNERGVPTRVYAKYQHDMNDYAWNRTTPGTKSYWTEELEPGTAGFEELVDFAAPLMKREVQRDS